MGCFPRKYILVIIFEGIRIPSFQFQKESKKGGFPGLWFRKKKRMIVVSRQQKAHAVLFSLKKGLLACFL